VLWCGLKQGEGCKGEIHSLQLNKKDGWFS